MTLDLSKVLVFRCYRKPDGQSTGESSLSPPSYGLNLFNNNSIKVNSNPPIIQTTPWSKTTEDLHQVPWIKIIKKKNKLPTVELVSRVMYRLSDEINTGTNTKNDHARLSYFNYWNW